MKIQKASTEKKIIEINEKVSVERPETFENFIWQESIKNILKSWIVSSIKRKDSLWHTLFSGDSGFGKTTLARIISNKLNKDIKIITAYAMEKPSDMISALNQLQKWDILFIDEIHRLKPKIEEILYIAMEDFRVDIVLQDQTTSIPIDKFTLIGATNKLENLSDAFKNRFVYKFHLSKYSDSEKQAILEKYLKEFDIKYDKEIIKDLSSKTLPVPREIKNLAIKIRDYLISSWSKTLNFKVYENMTKDLKLWKYWLSDLQMTYLKVLNEWWVMWLQTLSSVLNVAEKVIEKDIEPILINIWIIEKTRKWRKIKVKLENQ